MVPHGELSAACTGVSQRVSSLKCARTEISRTELGSAFDRHVCEDVVCSGMDSV
jgi:hypothetical protein